MNKEKHANKKYVTMSVLVKPHEFSQFLRIPRRTLIETPRAIFDAEHSKLLGYILYIIEER